jgi:hypothetical protein
MDLRDSWDCMVLRLENASLKTWLEELFGGQKSSEICWDLFERLKMKVTSMVGYNLRKEKIKNYALKQKFGTLSFEGQKPRQLK